MKAGSTGHTKLPRIFGLAFVFLLFVSLCQTESFASEKKRNFKLKSLTFSVQTNMPGFYFEGSLQKTVSIKNKDTTYHLLIPIEELTTELSLRDRHMRRDIFKNQDIRFTGKVKCPNKTRCKVKGQLEMAGQKKTLLLVLNKSGKEFKLNYQLKLSDFSIPPPEFMGVKVKNEIAIVATVAR